ncbi:MAG: hypothetical protein HYY45_06820 [Deltaproteobacteria bacterium]|nr:hypothetical protein [Deltaproteobacteria bacterium]
MNPQIKSRLANVEEKVKGRRRLTPRPPEVPALSEEEMTEHLARRIASFYEAFGAEWLRERFLTAGVDTALIDEIMQLVEGDGRSHPSDIVNDKNLFLS